MSDTTAEMLKDRLNDIERNAYDGADIRQDVTAAYALADELGNERDQLKTENDKLRELLQRLLTEYRYMRVRPRAMYLQHEGRMRAIEEEMRELEVTADD